MSQLKQIFWEQLRPGKVKVTWKFDNWSPSCSRVSPEFFCGHHQDICSLSMFDNQSQLSLRSCKSPLTGYCRLSSLDADRKEVKEQKLFFSGFSTGQYCPLYKFIVEDQAGRQNLTVDDKLIVICVVAVAGDDPLGNIGVASELTQDLSDMLSSELFSDVVLSAGGQEFKAHKTILAARSPVFKRMFSSDLVESKSGRVELADVSAEVLEEMLKFMYTGKSVLVDQMYYDKENQGINQELAIGLLRVADKYQLDRLKAICEDASADSLTGESVNKILALSCLHRADSLKYQCIDFISTHTNEFIERLVTDGSFLEKALASDPVTKDE